MTRYRLQIIGLITLLATLACNAPLLTPPATLAPPPTFAPIRVEPASTAENENGESDPTAATEEGTNLLPTFTPRGVATADSQATPTSENTATPTATAVSSGPLSFTYHVAWRLNPIDGGEAIATVTITAVGGDGGYQYFRDEQPVTGPVFEYKWGSCAGNPGSFRVTAADGQSLKIDYFEHPPCP